MTNSRALLLVVTMVLASTAGVMAQESAAEPPSTLWVEAGAVLWDRPGAHGREVARVQTLAELPVTGSAPGWLRVIYLDRSGWVEHAPPSAAGVHGDAGISPCVQMRVSAATSCVDLDWVWLLSDLPANERQSVEEVLRRLPQRYQQRYGAFTPGTGSWFAVFRRRQEYDDFLVQYRRWLSVDASAVASGRVAAMTADGATAPTESVLTHEGVHLLNRTALGEGVPLWLEEGSAGCLDVVDDGGLLAGNTDFEPVLIYHPSGWSEEQTAVSHGGARAAFARLRRRARESTLDLTSVLSAGRRNFYRRDQREDNYEVSSLLTCYLAERAHPAEDGGIVEAYRNTLLVEDRLVVDDLVSGLGAWADELLAEVMGDGGDGGDG